MTEAVFTSWTLLCFVLLRRSLSEDSVRAGVVLGIALGWAALTRAEGLLLILACLGALTVMKRRRALTPAAGLSIGLFALIYLGSLWSHHASSYYTHFWTELAPIVHHGTWATLKQGGQIVKTLCLENIWAWPLSTDGAAGASVAIVLVLSSVTALLAGMARLSQDKTNSRLLYMAMALFTGLHLMAHTLWLVTDSRYLIVLVALCLLFLYEGILSIRVEIIRKTAAIGTALLLLAIYSYQYAFAWKETHEKLAIHQRPGVSLS